MADVKSVSFTILEAQNILAMYDFCKRWYGHEYARTAIAKVTQVRNDYLEDFANEDQQREIDSYANRENKSIEVIKIIK